MPLDEQYALNKTFEGYSAGTRVWLLDTHDGDMAIVQPHNTDDVFMLPMDYLTVIRPRHHMSTKDVSYKKNGQVANA